MSSGATRSCRSLLVHRSLPPLTSLPPLRLHLHPSVPAGVRRVRIKVALNVGVNDLLMVLSSDAELPWVEGAVNRAALVPAAVAD